MLSLRDRMGEEEGLIPRESRNPGAEPGNVVHWVTHARRRGLGMWAWLFHRVSAVMLIFLTVLHVTANQFGYIVPGGRLVTIDLLVFVGSFHLYNGVRVMLVEFTGWAARNEDKLFIVVLAATLITIVAWIIIVGP